MVRKVCIFGFWGPQGGQSGGHRGVMGVKNKVWLKMLKIAQFFEKSCFPNFQIFSPYLTFGNFSKYFANKVKNFKIEKTTFLDELGNFKHFEPYFIF